MTTYQIHYRDERGVQAVELDDVQLEDGIYGLWRGDKAVERIPADQIDKVGPSRADYFEVFGAEGSLLAETAGRRSFGKLQVFDLWESQEAIDEVSDMTLSSNSSRG